MPGRPRNVITFSETTATFIDDLSFRQILLHPLVNNRKIVAVSIVGAFRKGKSFLLDYMLRYLYHTVSNANNIGTQLLINLYIYFKQYKSVNTFHESKSTKKSADWIGEPDEPLKGFSWKSGVDRQTTGIVFWSDVFLQTTEDGEELAIILIDTQGLFDHDTPPPINAKIFTFTTLMSSYQIFNLAQLMQENHLEYLQVTLRSNHE